VEIVRGKFADNKNQLRVTTRGGDIESRVVTALLEHHDRTSMVIPFSNERRGGHNEMSAFDENENMSFFIEVHSYAVTARSTVNRGN